MNIENFKKIINSNIEIISTIDHPYTSPPSHIFDANNYLMKKYGDKILVVNWDVSLPGERTYRYDLITDTGLIAKLPLLYHYNTEDFYCNQSFRQVSLLSLNHCINLSLEILKTKYCLSENKINSIQDYCGQIINLSRLSYDLTPWVYTKNLLINLYRFVERDDMANFIKNQYCNYWLSEIMIKWIPWCIDNVEEELSIDNLVKNGVIVRIPFRVNCNNDENLDLNKKNLIKLIARGDVIPSFDIFLWSLYVAGIKHYGNDFGFFNRLAIYLKNSEVNDYQVSISGKDAIKILTLDKDYGVLFEIKENGELVQSQNHYQSSKSSRINSLFATIAFGGNSTIQYMKKYQRGQKERIIKL